MKKSYIITGLVLLFSVITIQLKAQQTNYINQLKKVQEFEAPTLASLTSMKKNIEGMKERLMLLRSSGVKAETLQKFSQEIESKEDKLTEMHAKYAEMKEATTSKYRKALEWKDNFATIENISIEDVANELGVAQEDLNLDNIDYILRTQKVSTELKAKMEKLADQLKAKQQRPDVVGNKLKSTTSHWKVKEAKEVEKGVKELIIVDKLAIKDRMFWEVDLGISKNNLSVMNISPILGYQLSERFALGVGPTWQRVAEAGVEGKQISSRLMARVNVVKDIFSLQVENLTSLSSDLPEVSLGESARLIGGRINLPQIQGRQLNFTLLHNLSQQKSAIPTYMKAWQAKIGLVF